MCNPAMYMADAACLGPVFSCDVLYNQIQKGCARPRPLQAGALSLETHPTPPRGASTLGAPPSEWRLGGTSWLQPAASSWKCRPEQRRLEPCKQPGSGTASPAPEDAHHQLHRASGCGNVSCCGPLPSEANKQKRSAPLLWNSTCPKPQPSSLSPEGCAPHLPYLLAPRLRILQVIFQAFLTSFSISTTAVARLSHLKTELPGVPSIGLCLPLGPSKPF